MSNFLITYNGLILEKEAPHSIAYRINSYLISTEFCPDFNCFIANQINDYARGGYRIYVYVYPKYFRNPFNNYCKQIQYMLALPNISTLPKTLIGISQEYGFYIYDNILDVTRPN